MADWSPIPVPPSLLGESPFWHPDEAALYWLDIHGSALHRYAPASGLHRQWNFDQHPGSMAPLPGGDLLMAFRDGLFRFSPGSGDRLRIARVPYDTAKQRFNDGKADPQGRFWAGTIHEERLPQAALYCLALDSFDPKPDDGSLAGYGGRPDGGAVDAEGCYWAACFEGKRLARFAPEGTLLESIALPVRCPTMPCFGGDDLRTLYVTTSREKRPADELANEPWAGRVLQCRVDVPGLPVNFADV